MKKYFAMVLTFGLMVISAKAQGLVNFTSGTSTAARMSTNSLSGSNIGLIFGTGGEYRFALYCSQSATSVNGQTAAISGNTNVNYAFNDSNWTLVGYATNTATAGRFLSATTNPVAVSGVAGGSSAQFVLIGWSANIGTDITAVKNWFGLGDPATVGWIGQSVVSGPITLGDGGVIVPATLFGSGTPLMQGFVMGSAGAVVANTAPYITFQPADVSVPVGSRATFSVQVMGIPTPSCQWRCNGTNIPWATGYSLTLTNVQLTDAGSYSAFLSNTSGSTNSATATLTVQPGTAPYISAQPHGTSVAAGGTASFTVTASGSTPLSYQWSFNSTNLPDATNATLTLTGVQAANAGSYWVTVTNLYGQTNSAAVTLTVTTPPQNCGYVIFANTANSVTKIFTNSSVGGAVTGLTDTNGIRYRYALFASATAVNVNGQTNAICGNASANYVFYDNNWQLVAYATNTLVRGRLYSASNDGSGQTPLTAFAGGDTVRLVVVGWSAAIGSDIAAVQAWFNNGNPFSDGWIGQSAVSGNMQLGNGGILPSPLVFGTGVSPVHGFTLGLASLDPMASYALSSGPAPVLTTTLIGSSVKLSWPAVFSSYGLQSANGPVGPWADLATAPVTEGTNLTVTIPVSSEQPFYRLIVK